MKISEVRGIELSASRPRSDAGDARTDRPPQTTLFLLIITTDEGISGYGNFPSRTTLEEIIRPALIGRNPEEREAILADLCEAFKKKGLRTDLLAWVDAALWDIVAKAEGKPLSHLLGGPVRRKVPVYASGLQFIESHKLPQEAISYRKQGFKAVKMKIGRGIKRRLEESPEQDIENVRAVREALGPEVRLMVDANQAYDFDTAVHIARETHKYDIWWFEEPLVRCDLQGYSRLKEKVGIKIAAGEGIFTMKEIKDMVEIGKVDILQSEPRPDIEKAFEISRLAAEYGAFWAPHNWGQKISFALYAHLGAVVENFHIAELGPLQDPLWEVWKTEGFSLSEGFLLMKDIPGLGVEINWEAVQKYKVAEY